MTNPAFIIATGVVVVAAAIFALFSLSDRPQATSYDRGRSTKSRFSPPPSPRQSPFNANRKKKRKSPQRCAHESSSKSTEKLCSNCGESLTVKIYPCNHECCKHCFSGNMKNDVACPVCDGKIDSISPTMYPFGKCKSCKVFNKLFKFLPCEHSLSLCFGCFEKQSKSYSVCPECRKQIKGCDPKSVAAGICELCGKFANFAIFKPCGHGSFCREHAAMFLKCSENECNKCGKKVIAIQ